MKVIDLPGFILVLFFDILGRVFSLLVSLLSWIFSLLLHLIGKGFSLLGYILTLMVEFGQLEVTDLLPMILFGLIVAVVIAKII